MNTNTEAVLSAAGNVAHDVASQHGVKALQQGKDKLMADLKTVVSDAQALLKEAKDSSVEGIAGMPAYLEDRFGTVKENFNRVKDTIESKAKYATAATDTYVRENPWKSLGFVTAASFIVSVLVFSACARSGK